MAEMSKAGIIYNLYILAKLAIIDWLMMAKMAEMYKSGIMDNLYILAKLVIIHWLMMDQNG